ncbi:hypothetical protein ACFL6I_25230 [candidate division KSB1 bacterium]
MLKAAARARNAGLPVRLTSAEIKEVFTAGNAMSLSNALRAVDPAKAGGLTVKLWGSAGLPRNAVAYPWNGASKNGGNGAAVHCTVPHGNIILYVGNNDGATSFSPYAQTDAPTPDVLPDSLWATCGWGRGGPGDYFHGGAGSGTGITDSSGALIAVAGGGSSGGAPSGSYATSAGVGVDAGAIANGAGKGGQGYSGWNSGFVSFGGDGTLTAGGDAPAQRSDQAGSHGGGAGADGSGGGGGCNGTNSGSWPTQTGGTGGTGGANGTSGTGTGLNSGYGYGKNDPNRPGWGGCGNGGGGGGYGGGGGGGYSYGCGGSGSSLVPAGGTLDIAVNDADTDRSGAGSSNAEGRAVVIY